MTFYRGFLSGTVVSVICYFVYNYNSNTLKDDNATNYHKTENNETAPVLEDIRILEKRRKTLKYGLPEYGPRLIYYNDHIVAYDYAKKIPVWVAEHITQKHLHGNANRKKSKFNPDPNIPEKFSARNEDYYGSGWSRGHMAPAGNYKYNQKSMDDTFLLTNVVPQDFKNNAGFWNRFEMYCRDLTKMFDDIRIFSGPLILPDFNEDGKLYVTYPVIGESQISVPTHFYKVIIAESSKFNQKLIGAFIVPNEPIGVEHDLAEYQVKLEDLEMTSGIVFLPNLAESAECVDLCKAHNCRLMSKKEFELFILGHRLQNAANFNQVQKIWNELKKKELEPDPYLTDLYRKKISEFEDMAVRDEF